MTRHRRILTATSDTRSESARGRARARMTALAALGVLLTGLGSWLAVGGAPLARARVASSSGLKRIGPHDPLIAATEQTRRLAPGKVREISLTAAPSVIRIGNRRVRTWAFNGSVPGPDIRVNVGDVIKATVHNRLPQPLTIHWHGIAIRNDMDGVPGLTQKALQPSSTFTYEFTVSRPGTYFYHSHAGVQLDRGLYGALIVQSPAETTAYDRDITLLLDDWIDGLGTTPDRILKQLQAGTRQMQMGSGQMPAMHGMGSQTSPLGMDTGDVNYPLYLINGREPSSPPMFDVKPGERIRLRLVNAGSDTPFRVAVGGQPMSVIATDGYPVNPVSTGVILIGMGERYDVVVTINRSGVFPIVARAEGKRGQALAVLRSGPGKLPAANVNPAELHGSLLSLSDLVAAPPVALPPGKPDVTYRVRLSGNMMSYNWGLKVPKQSGVTLPVRLGQRVRLVFENGSAMWHPMHLHGHTFQLITDTGRPGPRKDTVLVPPMGRVTVEFIADNPGQWALHCHNIYHAESGMTTVLSYVKGGG